MVVYMISNYEIKQEKNEDVLYLFLDYSVEFARLNGSDKKKRTLNKEIDDYIKKKKINFKGTKIILMAGGIIIGFCLLKNPLPHNNDAYNYNYTTNIITLKENVKTMENIKGSQTQNNSQEENKITSTKNASSASSNTKKTTTNTSKNNSASSSSKETTTSEETSSGANNTTASINSPSKSTSSSSNKASSTSNNQNSSNTSASSSSSANTTINKTMVTIKRSNGSIVKLELEEYLVGVVAAEMPASFQLEALKAQAIAARTYALKAIKDGITLTDTVSTQVYKDNNQLKNMWGNSYTTYYNKVKKAITSTEGLAIYYKNSLINAYYHSTSNGYTEDATAVFGSFPYLKSVESSGDLNVSSYKKTITLTYEDISNKLGIPITSLSSINITKNGSGRVDTIIIDNNTYNGVKFRTILGLRSTDFDIQLNENNINITTRGYGHGVGMSQYGANGYAKQGWGYSKILKHYYSGVTIKHY